MFNIFLIIKRSVFVMFKENLNEWFSRLIKKFLKECVLFMC